MYNENRKKNKNGGQTIIYQTVYFENKISIIFSDI